MALSTSERQVVVANTFWHERWELIHPHLLLWFSKPRDTTDEQHSFGGFPHYLALAAKDDQ
jgi:hypothetical protein